jgi:hypothetical protein
MSNLKLIKSFSNSNLAQTAWESNFYGLRAKSPETSKQETGPKFRVVFVYINEAHLQQDELKNVRKLCEIMRISFLCRSYNSYLYEEDADDIEVLPAYHVYEEGQTYPSETFSEGPMDKIKTFESRRHFLKSNDSNKCVLQ